MGVVYRGVRTEARSAVAIKVMHVALPDAMKAASGSSARPR